MNQLPPIHPGEVLREEFMAPLKLSAGTIARAVGVPRTRIERLAAEQVDLSADTALRLSRLFGTGVEFWMNIQSRYAIERTSESLLEELARIEPLKMPA